MCSYTREWGDPMVNDMTRWLKKQNIPTLLWGNYLLSVYGVPVAIDGIQFVVPDELVDKAVKLHLQRGFELCNPELSCGLKQDEHFFPTPANHLHVRVGNNCQDEFYIAFHGMSTIPGLEKILRQRCTMPANSSWLPPRKPDAFPGGFAPKLHHVRILTPAHYSDMLVNLLIRDRNVSYRLGWITHLLHLKKHVKRHGLLALRDVQPQTRAVWKKIDLGANDVDDILGPPTRKSKFEEHVG